MKQLDEVLGQNFQQIALDTFHEAELFAARYLPTGLAFLVTLGFAVTDSPFCMRCCTRQALRYAGTAESSSAKAAFVTLIERRIPVACVSACDVCVTPPARLLRRYPVYLSAGSFRGGDLPVLVYKKGKSGQWSACCPTSARRTVRCACLHAKARCSIFGSPARCSLFLWRCAAWPLTQCRRFCPCFSYRWCLPLAGLLVSLEGFFREGLHKNANRTLSVCYTRFLPGMRFCVFTPDLSYTLLENPFSVSGGRCDVGCTCPAGCSTACAAYCNIWRGKSRSRCERRHRFPTLCRNRTAFYSHS